MFPLTSPNKILHSHEFTDEGFLDESSPEFNKKSDLPLVRFNLQVLTYFFGTSTGRSELQHGSTDLKPLRFQRNCDTKRKHAHYWSLVTWLAQFLTIAYHLANPNQTQKCCVIKGVAFVVVSRRRIPKLDGAHSPFYMWDSTVPNQQPKLKRI